MDEITEEMITAGENAYFAAEEDVRETVKQIYSAMRAKESAKAEKQENV